MMKMIIGLSSLQSNKVYKKKKMLNVVSLDAKEMV